MSTAEHADGPAVSVSAEVSPVWLAVPIHGTADPEDWGAAAAADPPAARPPGADPGELPDPATQAAELARLLRLLRRQAADVPFVHAWVLGGRYDRLPRAVVPVLVMRGIGDLESAVREVLRLPPASVERPAVVTGTDLTGHPYARIRQVVLLAEASEEPGGRPAHGPDGDAPTVVDTVVEVADRVVVEADDEDDPATPRVTERFAACFPRPAADLTVVATCLADDPVHAAAVELPVWHLLDALRVRVAAPPTPASRATVGA